MKYDIGDFVEVSRWGYKGQIISRFENFDSIPEQDHFRNGKSIWLSAQTVPVNKTDLDQPWYHIVCNDGGSVLAFESRLSLDDMPDEIQSMIDNEE